MTHTNQKHLDAVDRVREELKKYGYSEPEKDSQIGVDLHATKGGRMYYFTIIYGEKKESKSVYSAISASTWMFLSKDEHWRNTFFIAEIMINGEYKYYLYTPSEMWERSYTPYVHLKCNPLSRKETLVELKDVRIEELPASRYQGEQQMLDKLNILPQAITTLKKIKE
jgi:hypothetical protein